MYICIAMKKGQVMRIEFTKAKWNTESDGTWLSLLVKDARQARTAAAKIGEKQCLYTAEIKEHRRKRSLDANSYFWVLCGKLAAVLRIPKEDVYRQYIKGIGDNFEIVPIRDDAVEKWTRNWGHNGLGWICESAGPSKFKGYTNLVCYCGSSAYDTRQMSCLIDFVVQDCKDQDIETLAPDEIAKMKARWKDA